MNKEDEKEFVSLANEFVQKCNLNVRVEKLSDCKDEFFVSLYQGLIGDNLKGLITNPLKQDERVKNCQCVIDGLAKDVLNVDLSHISAKGIASGEIISIRNLLEIFSGLLEYFMECISENDLEDDLDDSDVMSEDHDVISSLLKEEFGSSYKDVKKKDQQSSSHRNKAEIGVPSSYYDRSNHSNITNSRMSTDPALFRSSLFSASGHEADMSQVSDSTNELIKLGESSSSGNSTVRKIESARKSNSHQEPVKTTWKHSILSGDGEPQDLTQYTLSSDEGDRDSLLDTKNGSDNLSSSVISSTSSWRQQISPLDADNEIKLDTLGVRPKVDSLEVASTESSKDGGSGRSTPVLHHHYHHHFHHPVRSDSKTHKTATSTSTHYGAGDFQDYTKYPGNVKTSAETTIGIAPQISNVPSYASSYQETILPGQGTSVSKYSDARIGLSGKHARSDEIAGVTGQSTGIDVPGESFLDSSSRETGLPGQTTKTGFPSLKYSQEDTRFPFQRISNYTKPSVSLSEYSRPSTALPGQSTESSITSTSFPNYTSTRYGIPGSSQRISNVPLSSYSRLESGQSIVGQSTTSGTTSKGFTDYPSTLSSLAGQNQQPRMSGLPVTDYTRLAAGTTSQRPGNGENIEHPMRGSVLPGPTHASKSVHSELPSRLEAGSTGPSTSNGLEQRSLVERYLPRATSLASTLPSTLTTSKPSSSGLHTVSSSGLTDSVFTGTGTSDLRKKFPSSIPKPLDRRQAKGFEGKERLQVGSNLYKISPERTTASEYLDKSVSNGEPCQAHDQDIDVDSLCSDDDDNDDDDGARYSDSAIDYNRGDVLDDSESEDSILRRIHERWKGLKTSRSSKRKPVRRAVTFNEDIQTIPITSRMDRLRRLLEDEAEEQRQQATAIRDTYAEQLLDIQKHQQQERKQMKKRKVQGTSLLPKKKTKKTTPTKQRGRLEAIYRPQARPGRAPKRRPVKSRKRSASASPDIGRRRKSNTVADFHESLLPSLFEEFPFLHVSPQTTHAMWQKQARQISLLSKPESTSKKTKGQRNVEEAEKRQEQLLKILRKELEFNQRMRGERERQEHQRTVKAKVNEKRQVAARTRRYYDEYQLRMRSKMLKRRTREEQILKRLFDDGLEIQKQRVRELRKYAKEKTETLEQKQSNEIESLENYYKDQFSMLAEGMSRERRELQVRQQAQEKVMRQMRGELRKKMEKEIQNLQETIIRDEDSAYFRQLEADRLRREFQLAMYKSDL